MTRLVAVDPGKKVTGVAVFGGGRLVCVKLVRAESLQEMIEYGPEQVPSPSFEERVDLAVEVPQAYAAGKSKGNPNDLVDLALVAGAFASECHGRLWLVRPARWKGQAPKGVIAARVRERLDEGERARITGVKPASLTHNAWDAVGIGLWALGRLR